MERFELIEGSSNKFWEVWVTAKTLSVRWGRIGSEGQTKSKAFASAALAGAERDKLIAEKVKKGYKAVKSDCKSQGTATTKKVSLAVSRKKPITEREASSASALVKRLDDWLRKNRSDYYDSLLPGASTKLLKKFEENYSIQMPETFHILYKWRNGQSADNYDSFQDNRMILSLEGIVDAKDFLDQEYADLPKWWNIEWIPFLYNGAGDYLCIALDLNGKARSGRLITYWHDDKDRAVTYQNIDEWLEELVSSMEGGTYENW